MTLHISPMNIHFLDSKVEAESGEAAVRDLGDNQGTERYAHRGASQALMSGDLGAGESTNPAIDHGSAEGPREEMNMPATAPSHPPEESDPNAVSSEPEVEESSIKDEKEVVFRITGNFLLTVERIKIIRVLRESGRKRGQNYYNIIGEYPMTDAWL